MPKERILVVDDEELTRWSLTEALRSWGYSSVEAAAGSVARAAFDAGSLRKEVKHLRRERSREFSFDQIVGSSPGMRAMFALARKVAGSEVSSVLLEGESGTGKDMVAKAIHYSSRRSDAPFIAINC